MIADYERVEGRLDRQGQATVLPPGPGPTPKAPTAHHRPPNLRDHLAGFLAANNAHGFEDEDFKPSGAIMKLLDEQSKREWPTIETVKSVAWSVKKHAKGEVKHTHAIEIVAAVLGYRTYHDLLKASVVGHRDRRFVKNLRYEAPE